MSYHAHDEQTFEEIRQMLENLGDYTAEMNGWEMNFVADLRTRLYKHGRAIALSEKQHEKLCDIHIKYCEGGKKDKQKDTVDGFRELENRDKNRRF